MSKIIKFPKMIKPIDLEAIEEKWFIDFDEEIKNNAKTIPEKIAVFIWEITGKTGYLDIEFWVKSVFCFLSFYFVILFLVILFVLTATGLEKLSILLR